MPGICSDCRYKGTCGETSRTQTCEGKKKFARSTPDKWGYMEYCVEVVTAPYEFEMCKNRTEAKQKCFEDLDKQLADVKERMHNAIDEM